MTVLGQPQEIRITERQKEQRRVLTEKDRARGWPGEGFDLAPTGFLVLQIEKAYWSRNSWIDKKHRQIEECLNEFIEGLVQSALIDQQHARGGGGAETKVGRAG